MRELGFPDSQSQYDTFQTLTPSYARQVKILSRFAIALYLPRIPNHDRQWWNRFPYDRPCP